MNALPEVEDSFLIRTDFSDDRVWQLLLAAATACNDEGFAANVHVVDDLAFEGAGPEQLLALVEEKTLFFIADRESIAACDMNLLAIRSQDGKVEHIRVAPGAVWAVENAIAIGACGWADFADAADEVGVFRGF